MHRNRPTRTILRAAACLAAALCALPAAAGPAPTGDWPMPRRTPANWARCDVPGRMHRAPREIWRYGGSSDPFGYVIPVRVRGRAAYFGQVRAGLRLVQPDGRILWKQPNLGIGGVVEAGDLGGVPRALVTTGADGFAMIDIATGKELWRWSTPHGSFLNAYRVHRERGRVRLFVYPQNSLLGFAFDIGTKSGVPTLLWQHEYRDAYWANFGPSFMMQDMDRDGQAEIVLAGKPGYMAIVEAATGAVRCDLKYDVPGADHFGRPYGLLTAGDVDGDGYPDLVMASCQVEEYLGLVRNEGGRRLRLMWARFVEQDFPQDLRELRPNVTSLADVNGDGRCELVAGLFNMTGDGRWHTLVIDPVRGFDAPLVDLPDRYFHTCCDLDGDGRPEIVTASARARIPAVPCEVQAVDGRTGRDVAIVPQATLLAGSAHLPDNVAFMASRSTPAYIERTGAPAGLLVQRPGGPASGEVWSLRGSSSAFAPLVMTGMSRAVFASTGGTRVGATDLALRTPAADAAPLATSPLVAAARGSRHLVLALSDNTVIGGAPDLRRHTGFVRSWRAAGTSPACWVSPAGALTVCTLTAAGIAVCEPTASAPGTLCEPRTIIRTPSPVMGRGSALGCSGLIAFGTDALRIYAGMQPGTHVTAGALYDAAGTQLWLSPQDGPYPRSAAAADLAGDGRYTLIVDNHGRHTLYDDQGRGRMIAHGWYTTIPGRGDGGKYTLPIVGPFGPRGETRIVMSSGLQSVETLDAAGARLARWETPEIYALEWGSNTVGRIRDGGWDIAVGDHDGILRSLDVETCRERWRIPIGPRNTGPIPIAAGDVDGDGRDEFVAGTPSGALVAVAEHAGKPVVLWTVPFDGAIRSVVLADVDGDGLMEVVVECDDGRVRVLR